MINTYNITVGFRLRGTDNRRGKTMNSIYASAQLKQVIWPDFIAHFRNEVSAASYQADIVEVIEVCRKDFTKIGSQEVAKYYELMQERVKEGRIQASTVAKKFRELHSFAAFIVEERERYGIAKTFQDYYYPYLKLVAKQERYAKSIPVEHVDKILEAAQEDPMAYCILVLLQRVGLSSTEIVELKIADFAAYDNGVYAQVVGRRELCFIPEDVFVILEKYIAKREDNPYLFYNSRRNKLNTMYISRLMKKYTAKADVDSYSAEALRNSCAFTMFAYSASPEQVALQMGITKIQIKRYQDLSYREQLLRAAGNLVKIKIEPPKC